MRSTGGSVSSSVLCARFVIRFGRETLGQRRLRQDADRRVLIVGAGAAGQMIVREIRENPSLGMIEVGFVDDDRAKIGTRIDGVPVLGSHEEIPALCEKHEVDEIIIAIPSAPPSGLRHILEHCKEVKAEARILPGVGDLIDGKVSVRALRNVDLEDLLGRDPVALDADLLHRHITGRTVMVTGAAGSIGSELCRQIARLSPGRLVLFEIAESPLFDLRDGDAGDVPEPGPGSRDRRRAGPRQGRGDLSRLAAGDRLPRGGVQARAGDGDAPGGGGEDERAGDADRGGGGGGIRGGAVRAGLHRQGGAARPT